MRKAAVVAAAGIVAALAVGVAPAGAVLIRANWVEKTPVSWGGTYTIYVREISVTKSTWRARVGIVNKTREPMEILYGLRKEGARTTLLHGPGIWFKGPASDSTEVVARYADATSVRPLLPHTLRRGKSWFGTIEGPTARLPNDRLLRIGFGWIEHDFAYPTEISTTHQFKLPRRL
jgi:hypothetical protein